MVRSVLMSQIMLDAFTEVWKIESEIVGSIHLHLSPNSVKILGQSHTLLANILYKKVSKLSFYLLVGLGDYKESWEDDCHIITALTYKKYLP